MQYPDVFSYCWINISNKYVRQVVLINHSRISPTLQKGWELEFCLYFKKWGRVHFSPKVSVTISEVRKIVEEWRLLRENNLCLLTNLCVNKSKKQCSPRYINKSNKFYYIPKSQFFEIRFYVKFKYIYQYIYICIPVWTLLVYFKNRYLYQNLACGAHFQFNSHDLFGNVDWN